MHHSTCAHVSTCLEHLVNYFFGLKRVDSSTAVDLIEDCSVEPLKYQVYPIVLSTNLNQVYYVLVVRL